MRRIGPRGGGLGRIGRASRVGAVEPVGSHRWSQSVVWVGSVKPVGDLGWIGGASRARSVEPVGRRAR